MGYPHLSLQGITRRREALILLIIFLFHALTNAAVLLAHRAPLLLDEAFYFTSSGEMLEAAARGDYRSIITSWDPHPPLQKILSLPFYLIFGHSPAVAALSTLVASGVLILSLYHIGKELQDAQTGLLSAAVVVLLPGVFGFSRMYMTELTLTAAVALSLALMLKSRGFSDIRYTFAFGLSVAVGLLAKWSYTAYALGPFLVYAYQSSRQVCRTGRRAFQELRKRGGWLLLSVFIGLLLVMPWYIPHWGDIVEDIEAGGQEREGIGILSSENLLFFVKDLPHQVGWFLFVAAAVSLAYLVITKSKAVSLAIPWAGLPIALYTFVPAILNKTQRYGVPYLPAVTLLIAVACMSLRPRLRTLMVLVILIGGIMQFIAITCAPKPQFILDRDEWGLLRPDRRDWKAEEIAKTINSLQTGVSGTPVIITTSRLYSACALMHMQQEGEIPPSIILQVESTRYAVFNLEWDEYFSLNEQKAYEQLFTNSHVALISDESLMDSYPTRKEAYIAPGTPRRSEWWNETPGRAWYVVREQFDPVREILLPDGGKLAIYVNKRSQGGEWTDALLRRRVCGRSIATRYQELGESPPRLT